MQDDTEMKRLYSITDAEGKLFYICVSKDNTCVNPIDASNCGWAFLTWSKRTPLSVGDEPQDRPEDVAYSYAYKLMVDYPDIILKYYREKSVKIPGLHISEPNPDEFYVKKPKRKDGNSTDVYWTTKKGLHYFCFNITDMKTFRSTKLQAKSIFSLIEYALSDDLLSLMRRNPAILSREIYSNEFNVVLDKPTEEGMKRIGWFILSQEDIEAENKTEYASEKLWRQAAKQFIDQKMELLTRWMNCQVYLITVTKADAVLTPEELVDHQFWGNALNDCPDDRFYDYPGVYDVPQTLIEFGFNINSLKQINY